jgi:hypothetical protein
MIVTLFVFVVRSRRSFGPASSVLSVVTGVVFAGFVEGAISPYFRSPPLPLVSGSGAILGVTDKSRPLPNIYHLVLDGLGRPDVLRSRYELDVTDSISQLERLGYVVEPGGTANYAQTYLSVASMLNMEYLEVPGSQTTGQSRKPLYDAIQTNRVFSTLLRSGYEVHFLASDYSATSEARLASTCQCPPSLFGEFESTVLYGTPFRAWLPGSLDYLPHYSRVEGVLQRFAASASSRLRARAQYTFAHVLSPHPPFLLRADGSYAPPARGFSFFDGDSFPGDPTEYRSGYSEQTRYLLRRAVQIAERLRSEDPTGVVIFSGDHGPRLGFSSTDASRTDAQEVIPTFIAIRWSGGEKPFDQVGSLVNLYREVFRRYLGLKLPSLSNRSYVSSFKTPYHLIQVEVPLHVR